MLRGSWSAPAGVSISNLSAKRRRPALADVTNPVDRPRGIVRNEQRAVRRDQHVRRTSPRLLALQPPLDERLVAHGLVAFESHHGDAIADLAAPVPRSVLGDED